MTTVPTAHTGSLFMAMELSKSKWKLAFSNGSKIRQVNVRAGDQESLQAAVAQARQKLGLNADAAVRSCYEAGRDGFWIDRLLRSLGIENLVVDAASIEVDRRARRAKTDRLDAEKLVRMLMRYHHGERRLWRVARVPSLAEEDQRRLHRELERLKKERTAHRARVQSLLALQGVGAKPDRRGRLALEALRTWEGQPLPAALREELQRQLQRLGMVEEQIAALEKRQEQALAQPQTAAQQQAAQLMRLRGVGAISAWLLVYEFFGWRDLQNRRQVGALAGLTGTPYASGDCVRDQGISKAGNKRVRWLAIELAWSWLRFQPASELTQWFWRRFGSGSQRMRRVGIVALARKLLVALWKYLARAELPAGAVLKAV
jgi:transposase